MRVERVSLIVFSIVSIFAIGLTDNLAFGGIFQPPTPDCTSNAECDDRNLCTSNICLSGTCLTLNNAIPCNDGNVCTILDVCSGGVCTGAIPAPPGAPCGGSDAECDALDTCNGSGQCIDNVDTPGTVCRADSGAACDIVDLCTGSSKSCPFIFQLFDTACGDSSSSDCDAADSCDSIGNCRDNNAPDGTACGNPLTCFDGLCGGALPVGGTSIPIDQSALLLAGAQSVSMWMIPVLIAGIGVAIFVIKRRN